MNNNNIVYGVELHYREGGEHTSWIHFVTKDREYAQNYIKKYNKLLEKIEDVSLCYSNEWYDRERKNPDWTYSEDWQRLDILANKYEFYHALFYEAEIKEIEVR